MINYSESCHDSPERNFGHTISALWKARPPSVAVTAPMLFECLHYTSDFATYTMIITWNPFGVLEVIHAFNMNPSTESSVSLQSNLAVIVRFGKMPSFLKGSGGQ